MSCTETLTDTSSSMTILDKFASLNASCLLWLMKFISCTKMSSIWFSPPLDSVHFLERKLHYNSKSLHKKKQTNSRKLQRRVALLVSFWPRQIGHKVLGRQLRQKKILQLHLRERQTYSTI